MQCCGVAYVCVLTARETEIEGLLEPKSLRLGWDIIARPQHRAEGEETRLDLYTPCSHHASFTHLFIHSYFLSYLTTYYMLDNSKSQLVSL